MEQLHDDQVAIILDRIKADGVTNKNLQNGLLDHYCCFIEERLAMGVDFESAYAAAFQTITPNGMQEIQKELNFILNFKKHIIMKRIIYLCHFLTLFIISGTVVFKTFHWDGASQLFYVALFSVIGTATIMFFNSLRHWKSHTATYNIRVIAGFLAALFIANGEIFKSLHLATANIQILTGVLLLNIVFLPIFFFEMYKKSAENHTLI
jgi:hypothetical protein